MKTVNTRTKPKTKQNKQSVSNVTFFDFVFFLSRNKWDLNEKKKVLLMIFMFVCVCVRWLFFLFFSVLVSEILELTMDNWPVTCLNEIFFFFLLLFELFKLSNPSFNSVVRLNQKIYRFFCCSIVCLFDEYFTAPFGYREQKKNKLWIGGRIKLDQIFFSASYQLT